MGRMHEAKIARVAGTLRHVAYLPFMHVISVLKDHTAVSYGGVG